MKKLNKIFRYFSRLDKNDYSKSNYIEHREPLGIMISRMNGLQ